jgi:hypothetical protein
MPVNMETRITVKIDLIFILTDLGFSIMPNLSKSIKHPSKGLKIISAG